MSTADSAETIDFGESDGASEPYYVPASPQPEQDRSAPVDWGSSERAPQVDRPVARPTYVSIRR
jgi:hypothetical protein